MKHEFQPKRLFGLGHEMVSQRRFQNLLGDLTGLLEQVGRPPELVALAPALNPKLIRDTVNVAEIFGSLYPNACSSRSSYRRSRGHGTHASRGETRELIALDRELTPNPC